MIRMLKTSIVALMAATAALGRFRSRPDGLQRRPETSVSSTR